MSLTKDQKEAVVHKTGPCLVVAGAGTGKTTVITRRIAWLIQEKLAKPEEILALTFTEKAAAEMISRVDELSDYIYSDLQISTFHSFGSDLISEFAFELGLPADYKVLTDIEQVLFIRDHIFDFKFNHFQNLSDPTSLVREMTKVFSRAKDELIEPKDWVRNVKCQMSRLRKASDGQANVKCAEDREGAEKNKELAQAYETYNNLLRKEGYIDYGDQIMLVLALLSKPSVAKKIKERYKFALVDEFQDTNYAQNELVKQIFGESGNVMVVGDDDQSIYKFRGAAVSNILDFREAYKKAKTIVLTENFRSTQAILDKSYDLIQNNNPDRLEVKYKINKKLVSTTGKGENPELLLFETESQEAEAAAEEILKLKKEGKDFSDAAVLFRANKHAEEFLRTFKKHGIPYVFSGASGLYEKIEVKMLVSLITALYDPDDDLALYHMSLSDVYNMNATELARIAKWSKHQNRPLSKAFLGLSELATQLEISEKTVKLASKIIADLSNLREEAKNSTAGEVVNLFLRESGYYSKLTREAKDGSAEAHVKIANIAGFFDKIIHFQRNYKDHSLAKFSEYLNLLLDVGEDPKSFEAEDLDAVNVLTIHKAKGLEFDTVFLSSLSDSHIPGRGKSERLVLPDSLIHEKVLAGNTNLGEERRLFYVAATRAKNNLYLTAALDYGTKKTHKISRFVVEVMGDDVVEKRFLKTEPIERIKHFEKVAPLYKIQLEPIPEDEVITLSRAQIDDWLTCPFKYQLVHITPIRIVADANVAFGNAVHNTIGEYYKRRFAGAKVAKNQMAEWFDMFWNEAGFLSKEHERQRYESGKKALEAFYVRAEKDSLPKFVEKEFKFKAGNTIIKGRYDAIFQDKSGTKIIDFKTSNVKKQEDADKRTKDSNQLATYALSWYASEKKIPDEVSLYFVESGVIGKYIPTEKDLSKTKEEIKEAVAGIRKRDFHASPNLAVCKYCPFKFYCPEAIVEKISS